jgi:hypothetical protein
MAVQVAARPASLSGCFQSWSEKQVANSIRTDMENGTVKVRRRTTGIFRQADVSVTLKGDQYQDFVDWWNVNCQQGALPTRVITPYGAEEVWRIVEPPSIEWLQGNPNPAFRASMKLERLPEFP